MAHVCPDATCLSPGGLWSRKATENVPAFAVQLDAVLEVPELGEVTVDFAYGGMFFVMADADQVGRALAPEEAAEATRVGEMIKAACQEQ